MKAPLLLPAVVLLILGCAASLCAAERAALVFGNQDYPERGRFPDLRTVEEDARVMHGLLKAAGFRVGAGPVLNASRERMEDELLRFAESLRKGDEAVIYFAGHGVQYENKVWLMGSNAEFLFKSKLGEEAVSHEAVAGTLGERGVKIAVILLDCCREVPNQSWLASEVAQRGQRGTETPQLSPPPNILVGFATSSERLTNDNLSAKDVNGPLVDALRRHWDAGLEFDSLWKAVAKDVFARSLEAAEEGKGAEIQMPSKYGQTIHDFFFTTRGAVKVAETPAPGMTLAEIAARDQRIAELEARLKVQETAQSVPAAGMTPAAFTAAAVPASPSVELVPSGGVSLALGAVGDSRSFEIGGGRKVVVKYVPGGEFLMGSPEGEKDRRADEAQVKVTLSSHYWMGETEVTQGQWEAVMGSTPSEFKGADLPVENVSWEDAQEFMRKLNARGAPAPGWKWALPTEAQWERACRGGTETVFSFGNRLESGAANFDSSKTGAVKSHAANGYGLYDMHGNVWEWCEDWHATVLLGGTDPMGPSQGVTRVYRGGSWFSYAARCRAAYRNRVEPRFRDSHLGFRAVLVPSS